MGCDIHMVIEVKHDSEWIGVHACPYAEVDVYGHEELINAKGERTTSMTGSCHWPIRSRNYEFFAALAGVRGEGKRGEGKPRGLPNDASALARMESDGWGADGHSHSYCTADKFLKLACKTNQLPDLAKVAVEQGMTQPPKLKDYLWKYLGVVESIPMKDVRVVFWFDN